MALNTNKNNPLVSKIRADNVFGGGVQDNMRASMNSTYANLRASIPGYGQAAPVAAENPFAVGMPAAGVAAPVSPLNVATGNIFGGGVSPGERSAATGATVPEQVAGVLSGLGDQGRVTQFQNAVKFAGFNLDPTGQLPEEYQGALAGAQNIYNSIFGAPGMPSMAPAGGQQTFAPTGLFDRVTQAQGAPVVGYGGAIATMTPGQMIGEDGRQLPMSQQRGNSFTLTQNPFSVPSATFQPSGAQGLSRIGATQPSAFQQNAASFKNRLVEEQQRKAMAAGLAKNYVVDPNDPTRVKPLPGSIEEMQLKKLQQDIESGAAAATEKEAKSVERKKQTVANASRVLGTIDRVLPKISNKTVGWGSFLSSVPESEAKDVEADIKSINASLGLDTMLALKEASATGSTGMGNQTEREFENMVVAKANLDRSQSPEQIRNNLQQVRTSYDRLVKMANGIDPYAEEERTTPAIPTFTPEKQKRLEELRRKLGKQ